MSGIFSFIAQFAVGFFFIFGNTVHFVSSEWHFCYSCSHSTDYPSIGCLNVTDTSPYTNCSEGFCYSNIVYDKEDKSVLSVFRRCLDKDIGTACVTDTEHMVCHEVCQEDYCNGKTKYFNDSNKGNKLTYIRFPMFCCIIYLYLFVEHFNK